MKMAGEPLLGTEEVKLSGLRTAIGQTSGETRQSTEGASREHTYTGLCTLYSAQNMQYNAH